jgi:hypothetical protein
MILGEAGGWRLEAGRGENKMKYTLVVINKQGASEESGHATRIDIRTAIRNWADPQNMTARVWDDGGVQLYDGPALRF